MLHRYRVFGLELQSALALPELQAGGEGPAAVTVALEPASRPDGLTDMAGGMAAGPGACWLEAPAVLRLLVRGGATLAVEPAPGAADAWVRAYLLASGLGAILHQRGLLPLHAAAVEVDGVALAFLGASGAGKSTLAAALGARGHRVLGDDVAAVTVADGRPLLWPGPRSIKLWEPSLAAMRRDSDGLARVAPEVGKYLLPIADAAPEGVPLRAAVVLDVGPSPTLAPLGGVDAAAALIANTFRGQLVAAMGRELAHFGQCVATARAVAARRLVRPWSLDALPAVVDLVEAFARSLR